MTRKRLITPGATLVKPFELTEQKLPTDKPVVQYIRQSTRKQKKGNKVSADMQDVDMKSRLIAYKWAAELVLPAISTDSGRSGTKRRDERSGLDYLYSLIETAKVGAIAAHNVSRIYRTLSMAETGKFCDLVLEKGIPVITSRRIYWPNREDNKALAADFQAAADYIEDHIKGTVLAAKNYHIENDKSYGGNVVPFGYVVDDMGNDGIARKFYRVYQPHAILILWLFKRFRELSGNLPLFARELEETGFCFPAFEDGIPVHVGLHASEDGSYPLRNRAAIISILTNRAYIGWYVFSGVIVSTEAHEAIVSMDDFLYAWERLAGMSLDGTEEVERKARERRYGGASALLDGIVRSNGFPVYVMKGRYNVRDDRNGFIYDTLVVPVETIDSAFAQAMIDVLASLELIHWNTAKEELYQKIVALQQEQEKKATDYTKDLERIDKEIRGQEMAQRVSREEGDETGYRNATRQLVQLRKDRAEIEVKSKETSTEASELAECHDLIDSAASQWNSWTIWKQKKLVKLLGTAANLTEASPHFLKLDVSLCELIPRALTVYIYRTRGSRMIWSEEEKETLRRMYPTASKQALMEALPMRGWGSMKDCAEEMGITRVFQAEDSTPREQWALCLQDYELMQCTGATPDKPVWKIQGEKEFRVRVKHHFHVPDREQAPKNVLSLHELVTELHALLAS